MPGRSNTLTADLQYTSGLLSNGQLTGLVQGTNLNGGSGALGGYVFRGDLTWVPMPAYENWLYTDNNLLFIRRITYQGPGLSRNIGPSSNQSSVCVIDSSLNSSLVSLANTAETSLS